MPKHFKTASSSKEAESRKPANSEALSKKPKSFKKKAKIKKTVQVVKETTHEKTVSSSIVAKSAPSSNWKTLISTIKPSPRKTIPVYNASKKRSSSDFDDDQDATSARTKIPNLNIVTGTKHDTTQLWFDDISKEDLEKAYGKSGCKHEYDPTETGKHKIGKYVGIDCEMVGVGPDGEQSALARVSIVNYHGVTVLDLYVRPLERVTDFRTEVSGITPRHLAKAIDFKDAQKQVADIIKDKIVVGHALQNDFKALLLEHPQRLIRDTSRYQPFRALAKGKTPSLRKLAQEILGIKIQQGSHSSVEDARITILLYRKHKEAWDSSLALKAKKLATKAKKNKKSTLKLQV
ncbi:3'-5' exonuclease [Lobosporangium transversale]|uniref:RNA exonuclease 4 n=1 Tax=Lobosporangium transversale TaxID=64571 RepID=A0A1Y2GDW2_9FUNG|nr:ribonuclease H-like domain-containing protein [Lobosporangium transversale]KAF9918251.1 3'-5' exonuclease [Lobosporangium transversale]ORZ08050.1 ribonuclease H-like domain-containing protein [Lobosporangium transversale]|eukprot:XP_021878284.1 ribonuclease H-like domain-containing protein [Lobosporangium transversale]